MEQIACIIGHIYIYWSDVVRGLAAAAAVCIFLALCFKTGQKTAAAVGYVPLAAILSLFLARMAHWYFRPDSYENLEAAMNVFQPGGFALMGIFAGCFLAAVSLRLIRVVENLPELLDCVSLAGSAGIALGRLASVFNTSDRGMIVSKDLGLPWVDAVTNPVSGAVEFRLATFLIQSMAAGLIFLVLLAFYLAGKKKNRLKEGDTTLLFLLLYGASQVVLDSTRYDSLYLRSNGFISAVQVLGAGAIMLAVLVFAVRMVRAGGWKNYHPVLWLAQAACFGGAGYMEYYVQRHGGEAAFAYSVMCGALAGLVILTLLTRHLADVEEKEHAAWLLEIKGPEKEESL